MQHLNTLWQVANAASQVAELARSTASHRFPVGEQPTFYLHSSSAEVRVARWTEPVIEVIAHLQAPFAWRIETDQDEAGVYYVARRRPVVGSLAGASFDVRVPADSYLVLKLENGRVTLDGIAGTLHVPPPGGHAEFEVRQEPR